LVFNIRPEERKLLLLISETSAKLGYPVYLVGGYVRDRLLGRPSKDIDVVCLGDGIKLASELASVVSPQPKVSIFSRFGTAMIKIKDIEVEIVGARKESYSYESRKPSVEPGSLEDDQNRRDFTINALAVSLNEENFGEIIDPFNGLLHLEQKLIKTPLEPGKTFTDDPLRMLRAIRFSTQLDFVIDPITFDAISKYKSRISIISMERVATELNKIICSPIPSVGFKQLFDCGLLHIVFPEMAALYGVEERNGIGHKDNFYHTLEVLDNVAKDSDNIWLRWAAILHDIAKPPTKRFDPVLGWTFHGHETLGAVMVGKIFKNLRLPLDHKLKYVQLLVKLHLRPIALTKEEITDSAVRRLVFEAGDAIEDLMILCKADITSKNQNKKDRYRDNYDKLQAKIEEIEERDRLRNWQPPLSGEEIMNIFNLNPSKEVGILKTSLREAILEGEIPNEYEAALEYIIRKGEEIGLNTH
jgi:putative nucleotidyltransferase with HDIG domain